MRSLFSSPNSPLAREEQQEHNSKVLSKRLKRRLKKMILEKRAILAKLSKTYSSNKVIKFLIDNLNLS